LVELARQLLAAAEQAEAGVADAISPAKKEYGEMR
jgi:hypothetical protein